MRKKSTSVFFKRTVSISPSQFFPDKFELFEIVWSSVYKHFAENVSGKESRDLNIFTIAEEIATLSNENSTIRF